jgi:ribose/xylose/arabinose/galactoside ABC-type transport system permease subunit
MGEPATRAIYFGVIAWLATWDVSLVIGLANGPLTLGIALDFIIVTLCLFAILWRAPRPWAV